MCKWNCDGDFKTESWEDKFDCSLDQFRELNRWVSSDGGAGLTAAGRQLHPPRLPCCPAVWKYSD